MLFLLPPLLFVVVCCCGCYCLLFFDTTDDGYYTHGVVWVIEVGSIYQQAVHENNTVLD